LCGERRIKMSINTVPQKAGLYWARDVRDSEKEWTLIVNVIGKSPFFQAHYWYYKQNSVGVVSSDRIDELEWGPQILRPGETDAMRSA
jgi:hypothetical protein